MGVFRATVRGLFNGVDAADNVFTFDYDSEPDVADDDLLDYLGRFYNSTLTAVLSPRWSCTSVSIEQPTVGGHWSFVKDISFTRSGSSTSNMLPQQTAALITGLTPSNRRGKKFIPGLCEESNDGGQLVNPGSAAVALTAAEYILDSVVTHLLKPGVCKPDGSDFLEFNSYRVGLIFASQRRRKQGVGS